MACKSPDCEQIFRNYGPFSNLSLMANFSQVPPLDPNPDVSGIGVLFAFLGTAYLTLLMVAIHFLFVPQPSSNSVDRSVLNGFWRFLIWVSRGRASLPSEGFGRGLRGPILMFSDQQIVTGVGILVAGFYQTVTCGLSSYHWQIIVYLAWFSSLTHLATLTLLRDYMVFNSGIRAFRLILMLGLFVLLVVALLPTGSRLWLLHTEYPKAHGALLSMPALCFFKAVWKVNSYQFYMSQTFYGYDMLEYSPQMATMTVSLVFIVFNYTSRTVKLFRHSSAWSRRWFRTAPGNVAKRMMGRMSRVSRNRERNVVLRWLAIIFNDLLLGLFTIALAILDLYESMFCEILFLFFALSWGTMRLFLTRYQTWGFASRDFLKEEDLWNFGQILPCMLLVLPVLSVGETFYETSNERNTAEIVKPPAPIPRPRNLDVGSDCYITDSSLSFSSSVSMADNDNDSVHLTTGRRASRPESLHDVVIDLPLDDHQDEKHPRSPRVKKAKLTWLYGESDVPTPDAIGRLSLRDRTHPVNFYAFTWFRDLQAMLSIDFCVVAVEMLLFESIGANDPFTFALYTGMFAAVTVASLVGFVLIQIVLLDNDENIMVFFERFCRMKREARGKARKWFRAILWVLFATLGIYLFATMPISQSQANIYGGASQSDGEDGS